MPPRWLNSNSSLYDDPSIAEVSNHRICPCRGRHPDIQRRPHQFRTRCAPAYPAIRARSTPLPDSARFRKLCAEGSGSLATRRTFLGATGRQTNPGTVPKSAIRLCHVDVADRCRNLSRDPQLWAQASMTFGFRQRLPRAMRDAALLSPVSAFGTSFYCCSDPLNALGVPVDGVGFV